jgi:molybdenum cofactor cytidylyltransferase
MTRPWITGVVLAAGGSSRLGTPKQLLPYRDSTVLGATLDIARSCPFDQLIVTLGGAAGEVRSVVPLDGVQTAIADDFGTGCSASLRSALPVVDPRAAGIVLMLGDQPGIAVATVERLITEGSEGPLAVCRYADGIGHPFWLGRSVFGELDRLHGDKGVWKVIESGLSSRRCGEAPGDDAREERARGGAGHTPTAAEERDNQDSSSRRCGEGRARGGTGHTPTAAEERDNQKRFTVREVRVDGAVPLDVDTWDDYQRLLASVAP